MSVYTTAVIGVGRIPLRAHPPIIAEPPRFAMVASADPHAEATVMGARTTRGFARCWRKSPPSRLLPSALRPACAAASPFMPSRPASTCSSKSNPVPLSANCDCFSGPRSMPE